MGCYRNETVGNAETRKDQKGSLMWGWTSQM
jgi:hypothetical protein